MTDTTQVTHNQFEQFQQNLSDVESLSRAINLVKERLARMDDETDRDLTYEYATLGVLASIRYRLSKGMKP